MADNYSGDDFREILDKFREAVEKAANSGTKSANFEADKRGNDAIEYFDAFMKYADETVHSVGVEMAALTARVMDAYPDAIDPTRWRTTLWGED